MNSKLSVLTVILVTFATSATADIPEVEVTPQNVTQNLSAGHEHYRQFTFENLDDEDKVYNMTFQDTGNWEFSPNRFNINASGTTTVNATYFSDVEGWSNVTVPTRYFYNGTANDFDGPTLDLETKTEYLPTEIQVEVFDNSFRFQLGQKATSVFRVNNSGSETAYNISIAASNNTALESTGRFDLRPDEYRIIRYNVSVPMPEENKTEATNQTYEFDVKAAGDNVESTGFTAYVRIPFKQYKQEEQAKSVLEQIMSSKEKLEEFCGQYEESVLCGGDVVKYRNNTVYVNKTPRANVTLTNETIEDLNNLEDLSTDRVRELEHRLGLTQNTIRNQNNKTRTTLENKFEDMEERNREQTRAIRNLTEFMREEEREEDRIRSRNQLIKFILLVVGVLAAIIYGIYRGFKRFQRKHSGEVIA
jgi:hypothetical protein